MLKTATIDYQDKDTLLEGYYAYDDRITGKRPAVLVCHDWSGKNDFAKKQAELLAELGYLGFALDMYGKGKIGSTNEEKSALMQPLISDRQHVLLPRLLAAWNTMKSLPEVDPNKTGAIGFCFGGLCALDLARSGVDIQAVASFHGLLNPLPTPTNTPIKAKILAFHGFEDPMVPPAILIGFATEMTKAKAIFEIDIYGHTQHAFTNPTANDPHSGLIYQPLAATRSAQSLIKFLAETL